MANRYYVEPKASYEEPEPLLEGRTVVDPPDVFTGLVDEEGRRIMRRAMGPIGFREAREHPEPIWLGDPPNVGWTFDGWKVFV